MTDRITDKASEDSPFFIGYLNAVPKGLGLFLLFACLGFIGGMAGTAFFSSSNIQDPGDGTFRFDLGRQEFAGKLEFRPYPVLRLPPTNDQPARTLMMSGAGKRGVIERGREFNGQMVQASGVMLERGDVHMLQLAGGARGLSAPTEESTLPDFIPSAPVSLGRWRLSGEICDGKCYVGAMRPGTGLSHKACANLCLFGGIPPVFVSAGPVDGSEFFLLADSDGTLLGPEISPFVALLVSIEGEVERLDDLLVFKADFSTLKVQ